jgi:O-succinylbenzoic acid--CoA ligase
MEIPCWLAAAAARAPRHPAIETVDETVGYADLLTRSDVAARRLAARGVTAGERVALVLPPGLAFAEALHGCWRLGAVPVPVDPRLAPAERAARTRGVAAILDAGLEGDQADAPLRDAHAPGATAAVVHTSGTTSTPRPIELTFANFTASARGSAAALGHEPGERWLSALPVAHVGGLSVLIRSAAYATTAVVHEAFDAAALAASLRDRGATMVSLVATMLARLLDAGLEDPPSLRCALVGGGALPPALAARAAAAGIPVAQTYGLTEACSQVTTSAIGEPETAGRPLPGTRVEVAADGEILVAGPTVAPTAAGGDGRLHTGDLGVLDAAGRLTVTGRKADTIVTGGENVAPAEVEAVLAAHPAVAEVAVYARDDPEWGERVVAAVVLRPGADGAAEDLRAHCRATLAGFKVPKEIWFSTDGLPRTPSGKLLRRALA